MLDSSLLPFLYGVHVLFMFLYLFTYTVIQHFSPCQMMFLLLNSNMKGATSGAGTAYTFGDIEFTTGYSGIRVTRTLV